VQKQERALFHRGTGGGTKVATDSTPRDRGSTGGTVVEESSCGFVEQKAIPLKPARPRGTSTVCARKVTRFVRKDLDTKEG